MPATKYKVWAVGAPLGVGATGALHIGIAGIAKPNSAALPLVVANELVCGLLAKAILLPSPPGFIIEHNSQPYYVSLNFNLAGVALPPADVKKLVASQPELASGVLLFDAWVANGDRHRANIAYDESSDRVEIFDHSHASFSNDPASLASKVNQLAIGGHCLAPELRSLDGMRSWHGRINSIPEFYIREVIEAATEVGLPPDRVNSCSTFLLERRPRLLELLASNRASFPNVDDGLFDHLINVTGVTT